MDHGAPGAPTGELLSSPHAGGQEQHQLKLNEYRPWRRVPLGSFEYCLPVRIEINRNLGVALRAERSSIQRHIPCVHRPAVVTEFTTNEFVGV